MTRFARAKGSKASNERIPEDATSWSDMKQQLLDKTKQAEEGKKRQEMDKQKVKNYKDFLHSVEEEQSKKTKWAEFPTNKQKNETITKRTNYVTPLVKKKKLILLEKRESEGVTKELEENKGPVIKKRKKVINEDEEKPEENQKKVAKRKLKKIQNKKSILLVNEESEEVKTELEEPVLKKLKKSVDSDQTSQDKPEENQKKVIKKKSKKNKKKIKKPIDLSTLPEEEKVKVEKKKEKKLRQLEKKKSFQPPNGKQPLTKERRKKPIEQITVNGREIDIAYVHGFPVKKEDANRLHQLHKDMKTKGLPRSEIDIVMKLERRKAEKALAREKKKVCFNCRQPGHNISECPNNEINPESGGTGICYKCGSTEHTHFECKVFRGQTFNYAQCFVCHEQGHIAKQCPDNPRGLYPNGGCCNVCGDVTHLKKDCPVHQAHKEHSEQGVHAETIADVDNPDNLDTKQYVKIIEDQPVIAKRITFK